MSPAIGHIALMVQDPERTARLFEGVFGAKIVARSREGRETFARVGGTWFVLVKGHPPASVNGDHVALLMTKAEQADCAERLTGLGIAYQMARGDSALYFQDYDNHVFELDTASLDEALGV